MGHNETRAACAQRRDHEHTGGGQVFCKLRTEAARETTWVWLPVVELWVSNTVRKYFLWKPLSLWHFVMATWQPKPVKTSLTEYSLSDSLTRWYRHPLHVHWIPSASPDHPQVCGTGHLVLVLVPGPQQEFVYSRNHFTISCLKHFKASL